MTKKESTKNIGGDSNGVGTDEGLPIPKEEATFEIVGEDEEDDGLMY